MIKQIVSFIFGVIYTLGVVNFIPIVLNPYNTILNPIGAICFFVFIFGTLGIIFFTIEFLTTYWDK